MVKKPPCNAGDMGLIPGWETRIPHAVEQLNPHTATTEPATTRESMRHNEDPKCHN